MNSQLAHDSEQSAVMTGGVRPVQAPTRIRWGNLSRARKWLVGVLVLALALGLGGAAIIGLRTTKVPPRLTQEEINTVLQHTLATTTLPSAAAKAYEIVRQSVVRVVGLSGEQGGGKNEKRGVGSGGSGVVIVDRGTILTALHVVAGAKRIVVTFSDGMEAEATIVSVWPETDLAVIQAHTVPDDLPAAILRSTANLMPGDHVVAVGFPFGIGPSATAGVISGMRREYHPPDGNAPLSNLIQFDAAANPGSSGGPLITDDGEVVGIVSAILNPTEQRVFIGIGFAVPIENAATAVGLSPF